jgi:hypothetical protein
VRRNSRRNRHRRGLERWVVKPQERNDKQCLLNFKAGPALLRRLEVLDRPVHVRPRAHLTYLDFANIDSELRSRLAALVLSAPRWGCRTTQHGSAPAPVTPRSSAARIALTAIAGAAGTGPGLQAPTARSSAVAG